MFWPPHCSTYSALVLTYPTFSSVARLAHNPEQTGGALSLCGVQGRHGHRNQVSLDIAYHLAGAVISQSYKNYLLTSLMLLLHNREGGDHRWLLVT